MRRSWDSWNKLELWYLAGATGQEVSGGGGALQTGQRRTPEVWNMYVSRPGRFMQSQLNLCKSWKRQICFYDRDCKTSILHLLIIGIIIILDTKHVSCTIIDILDKLCLMVDPKMLLWESVDFLSDCNLCTQCLPLITCQRGGKQTAIRTTRGWTGVPNR